MKPRIVQKAQSNPTRCSITGSANGPFIEGNIEVRGFGRPKVSISGIAQYLRAEGWLPREEVESTKTRNAHLESENNRLRKAEYRLGEFLDALEPLLPGPEIERVEVRVPTPREPTEAEIAEFLARNPKALKAFAAPAPGSVEEWEAIYRPSRAASKTTRALAKVQEVIDNIETEAVASDEPPAAVEYQGTTVDLDEALSHNVADIAAFLDGHEPLHVPAAARERFLAEHQKREPRKMVLRACGEEEV